MGCVFGIIVVCDVIDYESGDVLYILCGMVV